MNVLYVHGDSAGKRDTPNCAVWRCIWPASAIYLTENNSAAVTTVEKFLSGESNDLARAADLIVLQRNLYGPAIARLAYWKAHGKAVVLDIDDSLEDIYPTNSAYPFWIEGKMLSASGQLASRSGGPALSEFLEALPMLHAATMPSKTLRYRLSKHLPCYYLPNFPETTHYLMHAERVALRTPRPTDSVIIGWGGSSGHMESFTRSGIIPALHQVLEARPNVTLALQGDPRIGSLFHLPAGRVIVLPWSDFDAWPKTICSFDIGLAPLAGEFDAYRSWAKVVEYMLCRVPCITSNSPAYADVPTLPSFKRVLNTKSAWTDALLDMVDHLADYRAETMVSLAWACSLDVHANVQKILDTYDSILDQAFQSTENDDEDEERSQ
jgi:hypothetical protein